MWKIPIGPIRRLLLEGNGLSFAAVRGFRILGSNAAPAVPELARLISDPSRNVRRWRAMIALSGIGREGFPPLLAVLTNRAGGEFRAAECILELFRRGVDISPAVPTMLLLDREYRKSNVVNNVADPVYFVAVLAENPSFLIPALTNCLSHSNGDVRLEAVSTLAQSGAEARSAVPPLVHTFDDPEVRVREAATNAVRRIAPEVLEGIEQRQIHVEKSETNPSP